MYIQYAEKTDNSTIYLRFIYLYLYTSKNQLRAVLVCDECVFIKLSVCVCSSQTVTDQASTIPSRIHGCQSGTWSAGQENIRGIISTKLQRERRSRRVLIFL